MVCYQYVIRLTVNLMRACGVARRAGGQGHRCCVETPLHPGIPLNAYHPFGWRVKSKPHTRGDSNGKDSIPRWAYVARRFLGKLTRAPFSMSIRGRFSTPTIGRVSPPSEVGRSETKTAEWS